MKNLTLQNKEYRSNLFNYLDGIAILSTLNTLIKRNILDFINKNPLVEFSEICKKNNANPGYLNVAFRLCKSQGFLNRQDYLDGQDYKISISINLPCLYGSENKGVFRGV